MRTHDILCVADGWVYRIDGVDVAQFPSWHLALTAAARTAEAESRTGMPVALRYGAAGGQMKDIQTRWKKGPDALGGSHMPEPVHASMPMRPAVRIQP